MNQTQLEQIKKLFPYAQTSGSVNVNPNSELETLTVAGGIYRKSFYLTTDNTAYDILAGVTNAVAQSLIIDRLDNITLIAQPDDSTITFFVEDHSLVDIDPNGMPFKGYKIIDGVIIEKRYTTSVPAGYEFTDIATDDVAFYGVSTVNGVKELDVYFSHIGNMSNEIINQFDTTVQNGKFYGCKMNIDGSTYRYKTFELDSPWTLTDISNESERAAIKSNLIAIYGL